MIYDLYIYIYIYIYNQNNIQSFLDTWSGEWSRSRTINDIICYVIGIGIIDVSVSLHRCSVYTLLRTSIHTSSTCRILTPYY